jgi:ATP phosphoribosyltransferase regulatory subunit
MTSVERWMLPDGIEEILPPEARQVEYLRRNLLDLFDRWGYDLVIPPMVEFTDSLLVGLGKDIDLLTFKVTDQLSGRSMGIRADLTPQIARIDAHSLSRDGVNRLCYAGHVVKAQMPSALDTRSPFHVGVELFGEADLEADAEIISLLLQVMEQAQIHQFCLDLGHVGIYRALLSAAGLNADQESTYFSLLQAKALPEIQSWVAANLDDKTVAEWLNILPRLAGARSILNNARESFRGAPAAVFHALDELESVAAKVQTRFPNAQLYFDLGELTGYHYLTGVSFAAFVPGMGSSIVRGGRYDHIGEVFGRARCATGFTADLVVLSRVGKHNIGCHPGIFVPHTQHPEAWQVIQNLRNQGERVVTAIRSSDAPQNYQNCNRLLIEQGDKLLVKPL